MLHNHVYIGLYKLDTNHYLGEGAFATVYSATSCRDLKQVAIKIDKNTHINSLKHEANILAYLNKNLPNVAFLPTLYWYGTFANRATIVTPYYKPATRFNPVEVITILQAIHSVNIIHCDIKPDNFMINAEQLVLIDFGLARTPAKKQTLSTTLCGNPRYASYFIYLGHTPDYRDDLISAGYMFMEFCGYSFPVIAQENDSIFHTTNLQRKQQRTLTSLLSSNIPKHLMHYFEYLYRDDLQIVDYTYLLSLFDSLEIII
jgi:serine/threonine protein kinase